MRNPTVKPLRVSADQILKTFLFAPLDRYESHFYSCIQVFKLPGLGLKGALKDLISKRFVACHLDDYGWEKYFLTALGFHELLRNTTLSEYLSMRKTYLTAYPYQTVSWTFEQQMLEAVFSYVQQGTFNQNWADEIQRQYSIDPLLFDFISELLDLEPTWKPIFEGMASLSFQSYFEVLQNRFIRHDLPIRVSEPMRQMMVSAQPDPISRERASDWLVFYLDFLQNGHPLRHAQNLDDGNHLKLVLQAIDSLSRNDPPKEAAQLMKLALEVVGKKRLFDDPILDWFLVIALFRDRESKDSQKRLMQLADTKKLRNNINTAYLWLMAAIGSMMNPSDYVEEVLIAFNHSEHSDLSEALFRLVAENFDYRTDHESDRSVFINAFKLMPILELETGYSEPDRSRVQALQTRFGMQALLPKFEHKAEWEMALDRLIAREEQRPKKRITKENNAHPQLRVLYLLNTNNKEISLKLQKSKDGQNWTKGTDLNLTSFQKGFEGMSNQDRAVSRTLVHPFGYKTRWVFRWLDALEALVGCPNVYRAEEPTERIEIVKDDFQVIVREERTQYFIETNCDIHQAISDGVCVRYPDNNRIEIVHPNDEEMRLLENLATICRFPLQAKAKLTRYLELLSRNTPVMSDLLQESPIKKIPSDNKITFRMRPMDDGIDVKALVRPLLTNPLTCEPGEGSDFIATNINGENVQLCRDRLKEKENWQTIHSHLTQFEDSEDAPRSWFLNQEQCLEFLEILRQNLDLINIEWPQKEQFSVKKAPLSARNLNFSVTRVNNWFELQGTVKFSDQTVISVADLLEKMRQSQGDFIRLGEQEYVQLTKALKKQLLLLQGVSHVNKDETLRVSIFNAPTLQALQQDGTSIDADKAYQGLIEQIRQAQEQEFSVPGTLRAQLRDYQIDGFRWLTRLSSWGAGALLADDMGLGKTIQTIALLVARAKDGPAMVVVPTAVLYNWLAELRRFAPSLNPIVYNDGDRVSILQRLKPYDVLLVTYGVMASEIEQLCRYEYSTIVLDEAHSIKNRETKMAKAAFELKGKARVLLTGTPLQNHLSEIWSLFEFANPGLLGSFSEFTQKFVLEVEKNKNRDQQRLLKRLISPFILRRTKAEVLEELPQKTEITLDVILSEKERALYESFREGASRNLQSGQMNAIEALAELTKLRQLVCDPRLVNPALEIKSSKTEVFLQLIKELQAGGHRALVFSQFTSHLALIKQCLDQLDIDYLYLDGSTPAAQRQKLVETFQKGEMPLFLISLKAGGSGLNLTAADYIIHLDPWWNPAVEDQATDRAYRIGQKNPVTIYKLIAKGTIEEKILELHETKKSLADALLEGTDLSSRLSREEILRLLSSQG